MSKEFGPQAELCRQSRCIVPSCVWHRLGSDPHHVKSIGAGGQDADCVPLCRWHHTEVHQIGWRTFEIKYGIVLADEVDVMRTKTKQERF